MLFYFWHHFCIYLFYQRRRSARFSPSLLVREASFSRCSPTVAGPAHKELPLVPGHAKSLERFFTVERNPHCQFRGTREDKPRGDMDARSDLPALRSPRRPPAAR